MAFGKIHSKELAGNFSEQNKRNSYQRIWTNIY